MTNFEEEVRDFSVASTESRFILGRQSTAEATESRFGTLKRPEMLARRAEDGKYKVYDTKGIDHAAMDLSDKSEKRKRRLSYYLTGVIILDIAAAFAALTLAAEGIFTTADLLITGGVGTVLTIATVFMISSLWRTATKNYKRAWKAINSNGAYDGSK